jgi:prepilin-type N-terminal cleavage/methylation domain-containing protein
MEASMSYRSTRSNQNGFTIIELIITLLVTGMVSSMLYVFFNNSLSQYFNLQKEATNFTDLARQSQRTANVLRGLTDITTASANELIGYSYFSPADTYVSLIRYYKNPGNTKLLADVTRMTSNPPIGTPITSTKQTFTIIENLQLPPVDLFAYLNSAGTPLALPVTDLRSIKGIRVNLVAISGNKSVGQTLTVEVSLRNRKTNL